MSERIARKVERARRRRGASPEFPTGNFKPTPRDPELDAADTQRPGVEVRELGNGIVLTTYTALATGLRPTATRSIRRPLAEVLEPPQAEPSPPPAASPVGESWASVDKYDDRN